MLTSNAAIRAWADSERETPTAGMVECSECEHLASPVLHCTVDGPCHGTGRVRAPCATCGGSKEVHGFAPNVQWTEMRGVVKPCPDCTDGLAPRVGPEIDPTKWDGDVDLTPILKPVCPKATWHGRSFACTAGCAICDGTGHGPPLVDVLPVRVPAGGCLANPKGEHPCRGCDAWGPVRREMWCVRCVVEDACAEVGVTLEVREAQSSSGATASPDSSTSTGSAGG